MMKRLCEAGNAFFARSRQPVFCGICLVLMLSFMTAASCPATEGDAAPPGKTQLQQRIDFGNAYIMGQSIKSGAVYLLRRKKSDIDSMLKIRTDFRPEIMADYALEDSALVTPETEREAAGDSH